MKRWPLSLLVTVIFFSTASAQSNLGYRVFDSIPVIENGNTLAMPWVGGFNNPQFSHLDLDGDGTMDLFVFDRDGNAIKTFINNGTANTADYEHAPEFESLFPTNMDGFILLRDYNCDGRMDLFNYAPGGFKVYRNDFDTGLKWTKVSDLLLADFFGINPSNIYVIPNDVPAIVDMDNDGDLDILSFGIGSTQNFMVYHQNLSMENYGTCDSLEFEFNTTCWGNVFEPSSSQRLRTFFCKGGGASGGGQSGHLRAHPGSTLLPIDLDGDNDKDLVIGDILKPRLLYIENTGDQFTANLDTNTIDTIWPNNTTPLAMNLMPAAYSLDVDNDDVKDLIVAPNNTIDPAINVDNVWYYKNTGTNSVPDFDFQTNSFLVDGMIDNGRAAHPLFFDVNGDGDYDLLIGNDQRHDTSGVTSATLSYYENVGQFQFAPSFELVTHDFANMSMLNLNTLHPTTGDLDGDGDEDLIVGSQEGFLHYFQNDPVNDSALFTFQQPANYMSIDVSSHATPQLVDANNDGLLDLIVGERNGIMKYYENIGTAQAAQFDSIPTKDTLGGIVINNGFNGYTSPFLTDALDTLGTTFLAVGTRDGKILIYDQVENNLTGTFNKQDSIVLRAGHVNLTGQDLLGDGKLDLLVGQLGGGVTFYTKALNIPIGVPENQALVNDLRLYPNPARDQLTLDLEANYTAQAQIAVVDLMGKQVLQQSFSLQPGNNRIPVDLTGFAQGIYFLQVQGPNQMMARRFIVSGR